MPDITMCLNNTCGKRRDCYRYMATPSFRQSYAKFTPKDGECDEFIKILSKTI